MAKRDFSSINTGHVYDTIAAATQDVQEEQPKQKTRKARKTYTEEEAQHMMETLQTTGRKGVKLKRINLAFSPANYDYVVTLSRVRGETMTEFINHVLEEHREAHEDIYRKAIEFKNSL